MQQTKSNGEKQKFLFVNKTGSSRSLSRGDGNETSRILSHVRNKGRSPKDQGVSWSSHTFCLDTDIVGEVACTTHPSQHTQLGDSERSPAPEQIHGSGRGSSPVSALTMFQPRHNGTDPFRATMIGMEATLFMHLINTAVDTRTSCITFLAEALAPSSAINSIVLSRHDEARHERLRACVDNELLMYSSIAHGARSLAWAAGNDHNARSHCFIGKTLQGVRRQLSDLSEASRKALMFSVLTLAFTELWSAFPRMWQSNQSKINPYHFQVCKTHLRALLVLVEQAGGWSAVSPYILECVVLMDKYVALHDLSEPVVPLTWDPDPIPPGSREPGVMQVNTVFRLGSSLLQCDLDSELQLILQELADFVSLAVGRWDARASVSIEMEGWIYLRFHAFHYRLLLYKPFRWIDSCVKLTALMFQLNLVAYAGGATISRTMITHLHKIVYRADFYGEGIADDLRLWILCTGAMVKVSCPEKTWFVEQLKLAANQTALELSLQGLSDTLQKFLYVSPRQDSDLAGLLALLV